VRDGDGGGDRGRTELIARWGRWRPLRDAEARAAVAAWSAVLGVAQQVRLERISRFQVTDHQGRRGCGLVGVVHDAHAACIYHSRALTTEDLVHELLHVAHPAWSEEAVVLETRRLLAGERASEMVAISVSA
jgi:hypothetical protein